jgi:RNA polymerase sigma factor (sigma-70 family)
MPDSYPRFRPVDLPTNEDDAREGAFEALYAGQRARVVAYVLRRCEGAEDAADVIAETFLVAWRRIDEVPAGDRARLWLYGVARRALANQRRGERRRVQLVGRLRDDIARGYAFERPSSASAKIAVAFRSLAERDREILALQGWEGLDPGEIAVVLGCSRNAARIRLHRARRQLAGALNVAQEQTGSYTRGLPQRASDVDHPEPDPSSGARPGRPEDELPLRGDIL